MAGGLPLVEVINPGRSLKDLRLAPEVKTEIDLLVLARRRAAELQKSGLAPPRTVLLWGPPGNGKTSTAEAVAKALRSQLVRLSVPAIFDSYLGASSKNLGTAIRYAEGISPCVLLVDEIEALALPRAAGDGSSDGETNRITAAFLHELDTVKGDLLLIAATNMAPLLDRAVERRFDLILELVGPEPEMVMDFVTRRAGAAPQPGHLGHVLSWADAERFADLARRAALLAKRRGVGDEDFEIAARAMAERKRFRDAARGASQGAAKPVALGGEE